MSATQRDFSDYILGDNVYELADGVIPAIAAEVGIDLGDEPDEADMQRLMQQVGPKKELRTNPELEMDLSRAAELLGQSGVQKAIERSLWTPEQTLITHPAERLVVPTGMANWDDRAIRLANGIPDLPVHIIAGNRAKGSVTELPNHHIDRFVRNFGRVPTESEYAGGVMAPNLGAPYRPVMPSGYPTNNGDEIFTKLFEENPGILTQRVALVRVANAGIISALQLRDAARKHPDGQEFDADPESPQIIVVTDTFPIAETAEDAKDAAHFQNPKTAIRQVVLAGLKLHIADREAGRNEQ